MPIVRPEQPADLAAIHRVLRQAFAREAEAALVDRLRQRGVSTLSLVAVEAGQVVGHILFTPVTITSSAANSEAVALGPLAVAPARQRRGLGSALVRAGLGRLRRAGHAAVIVLGHPDYYPRFGFKPAQSFGIRWEHPVPDEAFMALELHAGALAGRGGVVKYQPEFDGV